MSGISRRKLRWMNKALLYRAYCSVAKSCVTLCHPWTVACHAPLSVGFSRLEYRSGLSFPSPEDLPDPAIEPRSPTLQMLLPSELPGKSRVGIGGYIC